MKVSLTGNLSFQKYRYVIVLFRALNCIQPFLGIYWPLNILKILCLIDFKLHTLIYPEYYVNPIDFEVQGSKAKLEIWIYWPLNIWEPFASQTSTLDMLQTLYTCRPVTIRLYTCKLRLKKTRGPVSQQVWHDKDSPCSKAMGDEHSPTFCSLSPVLVTSP
jgi:hypothetical protein